MAVLQECNLCHRTQSLKNKRCNKCDNNLDKAKRSNQIKYYVDYFLSNGKAKRDFIGFSIKEAKDADHKIKIQKRENRYFDPIPDSNITFKELSKWYLNQQDKEKDYYYVLSLSLKKFNVEFGKDVVNDIKPIDLENFQAKLKKDKLSDSYVDQTIGAARAVINKAFDNDKISWNVQKKFKKVKKLLEKSSNARDRVLTDEEFDNLRSALPYHTRCIVETAYYTGMRRKEILSLTWNKVDLKNRFIELEADDTKNNKPRIIPICDELYEVLKNIIKAIHDKHVFLFRGKPIIDVRTALKSACVKAKIPYGRKVKNGFTFHDLRHTFNTNMRKAGIPESVIMEITGHTTREMFDRYNTIDKADLKKAIEMFSVKLDQILTKSM